MLRKSLLAACMLLTFWGTMQAQRTAYVDMQRILDHIEEYKAAEKELDQLAAKWQQEIEQRYDEIKGLYNRYQAEQVLLSDEQRRQREEEIMAKEREVRELQKRYFGPEGELFQRREELVRPIQERVYAAVEAYAKDRGFDFIIDISTAPHMIYYNPEYDKTEDIMDQLRRQ